MVQVQQVQTPNNVTPAITEDMLLRAVLLLAEVFSYDPDMDMRFYTARESLMYDAGAISVLQALSFLFTDDGLVGEIVARANVASVSRLASRPEYERVRRSAGLAD